MRPVYVALVHHPVRDRTGAIVTTAVTNLDVHDIARSARTYDLAGYFVVTPIEAQRSLVQRILDHWREGPGAARVPQRAEALARCEHCPSLEEAVERIEARHGVRPLVIVTAARAPEGTAILQPAEVHRAIEDRPALLVFGTGHGLAPSVLDGADGALAPIRSRPLVDATAPTYNHLSVRAAVAITLDRLFGD